MARKTKGKAAGFTMFNVAYEDGMVTSNRRVSSELLDQSFGDDLQDLARTAIARVWPSFLLSAVRALCVRNYNWVF